MADLSHTETLKMTTNTGDGGGTPPSSGGGAPPPGGEGGGKGGGDRFGGKKPFPKTFGDVMKGIPAGKGGDERPRRDGGGKGDGAKQEAGGRRDGGKDHRREPRRADEAKKGPVVVRKPAPLTARKEGEPEGAVTETAPAEAAGQETHAAPAAPPQPSPHDRKPPKTVFRRADGLNLPPGEGEKAPAPASEPEVEQPVEDFAAMFAQSEKDGGGRKRFQVGQKVSGRIVQMASEVAFLDLGGKGEGMISLGELRNPAGEVTVAIGELLEGYILTMGAEGIIITKQLSKGAQREFLHQARDSGIPIEGLVTGVNKGGLEVDLGGSRGFCPTSQIDVRFVESPASFVGQRLSFKITEVKDRDIVLSRRAFLEAEGAKKAEETRKSLRVGAQLDGTVTSVRDFGAFVDLGGIEGMLHVSEISFARVAHPKDVLEPGQKVRVEIVRIEGEEGKKGERIALSMKALQQDPWQMAAATFKEGDRLKGKIVRLQPFGAFVELMPGVDGLVHISALGANKRLSHPNEVVAEGEEIEVVIESMDRDAKRVSLRRITAEEAAAPVEASGTPSAPRAVPARNAPPKVGDVFEVTVDKVEVFGIFVRFPTGKGLVPNVEMGTVKGTDHKKQFPPGSTFKAAVIEIDAQGRLRMSRTAAEKEEERAEYQKFQASQSRPSGKGFGTLADLLAKIKKE